MRLKNEIPLLRIDRIIYISYSLHKTINGGQTMVKRYRETFGEGGHLESRRVLLGYGAFFFIFGIFCLIVGYYVLSTIFENRFFFNSEPTDVYIMSETLLSRLILLIVTAIVLLLFISIRYFYLAVGAKDADYKHAERRTMAVVEGETHTYLAEVNKEEIPREDYDQDFTGIRTSSGSGSSE